MTHIVFGAWILNRAIGCALGRCVVCGCAHAQVFSRTIMLALVFATRWWFAAVYLSGDLLLQMVYKAARRDFQYWVPGFGVPMSLLMRSCEKVFTDSTAVVQFRHPVNSGGLYYILNAVLSQACDACPHAHALGLCGAAVLGPCLRCD